MNATGFSRLRESRSTEELRLSGLIGTASHPDVQKYRIIGFLFEIGLHWQFEVLLLLFTVTYVVGPTSFRSDIQKPRQMENAVRDI